MNARFVCFILAVSAAAAGRPAAMAQGLPAPATAPAGLPSTPLVPASPLAAWASDDAPPTPGLAADKNSKDVSYPQMGAAPLYIDPAPQKRRTPLEVSWDDGLHFDSPDDQFHLHIGGVGQLDTVWLIGPQSLFAAPGDGTSGVGNAQVTELRRAILQADGEILGQFDYVIQYDFANASNDNSGLQPPSFGNLSSSPAPLNIWMQARDVPYLGDVRFGSQSKPIGMTNNTAAAFLPFMERSDNNDAFYGPFDNGFALGLAFWNWTESERATWRYGIYQPATNVFGVALNKYTVGARVTALPIYDDDGARLVHVGLGYWGGEIVQNELRDRARPLLRNAPGFAVPVLVDTGEVPGSRQYTLAPEFAMVLGPLTVQAEFAAQFLTDAVATNGQNQGTVFYHGGYAEALYFLTGEHQEYVRREGVFGRVVPLNDFHWKKGDCYCACGAWQVGVRFSYLDLDDKAIQGGQIYDWTVGLNWYLNPNMKVQLNYIAEHRDTPGVTPGWINGVGLRAGYDF
jgi:phosphate-selective porin OprO/OprP